ncbi:hypothetical protein CASFOL_027545 [Castilleja foliolosa]|uniref:Glycosyltransferase n=1 Tax=Castilleja foliolosa TaxID=1961234 RepID=A0ABD3CG33_9LAMI
MAKNQKKPHAIVIPLPFQGHITPYTNLALKLAKKGLIVTFVHFEFIHLKISKASNHNKDTTDQIDDVDFFSEARKSGLDIRYVTINDGIPKELDRDLNFPIFWNLLVHELEARFDEFIGKMLQSDPGSAYFLLADPTFVWPAAVADKYKLVNVAFSTQAASVFNLAYHWDLLKEKGHLPSKDSKDVKIDYIPGVESISIKDLMMYLDPQSLVAEGLFIAFTNNKKADFILHNTAEELESGALSALNKYHQPNYAVGPTNFFKNIATNTVSKTFWRQTDCMSWLDSKPPCSVLYVSFGSLVETSKQVIDEVAYGLLHSEVNFVWIVREGVLGSYDGNVLPVGFEDEVKGRGIIIPWCDQIRVLSDRAVGAFLTHNGWNSTLESMWCGVPMICYPLEYDQTTNAKFVVEDWKIGIRLCDHGKSLDRNEISEKIKSFMNGVTLNGFRQEAENVKGKLENALEIDGSSEKNIDRFINDLKEKLQVTAIDK